MIAKFLAPLAAGLLVAGCATIPPPVQAVAPAPETGAVSAADPRAQAAGEAILAQGGSATDAAIAVMVALTVVEPQSSGIGGGGFMVLADKDGTVTTIDGRETAPVAANPWWFMDPETGKPKSFADVVGTGLSTGVPGNLALAAKAHAEHGKLPWAALFEPAIALARDGFTVNRRLNDSLAEGGRAARDPAAKAIYFTAAGEPAPVGSRSTNPALAATLERIAQSGAASFYTGETAASLASAIRGDTPGSRSMTASDIESYEAKDRPPVCGQYREWRICGMGPPSSGGIAVLQMLGQLERFDLAALGPDSPTFWHLFLESQRLAYADREKFIGDSDFVGVPVGGLIDKRYLAIRSAMISPDRTLEDVSAGPVPGGAVALAKGLHWPEQGTSHFSVADADGNLVSYTSTIESSFGSGLMVGGFYLNNELTDFSFAPEEDGGTVANRVEGGKRPRSSMSPSIVFDAAGKPVLVIGAAGGGTIPVQVARGIIGVLDFGLPLEQALGLPLIMDIRGFTVYEKGSSLEGMAAALKALGHDGLRAYAPPLKANALQRIDGGWVAAGDPRIAPMLATE